MIVVRDTIIEKIDAVRRVSYGYFKGLDELDLTDPDCPIDEDKFKATEVTIEGRRFRNSEGENVVIGWDEGTQQALGLPFKVFESQEKQIGLLVRIVDEKIDRILELEARGVWQLIKIKVKDWWR